LDFFEPEIAPLDPPSSNNPTLEPNMEWIGRPVAEIWPFEIFQMRGRSLVGRRSVVNIYILTLISYTFLRYVRNVAREE